MNPNEAEAIKAREDAEERLRVSEERLRLATEAGNIGLWDWDITTNKVSWTDAVYAMHGLKPGEIDVTVETFKSMTHPEDRPGVLETLERTLKDDAPYELEFRSVRPNGEVIWIYTSARVIRENGRAVRMLGASFNITERKKTELALRESEERFAMAFDASPLILTLSSLNTGKLLEVNETFCRVSGFSREEAVGRTTVELGVWVDNQERQEELNKVRRDGKVSNVEYRFRTRSGEVRIGLLSAEKIIIGGEPYGLTVIQDITERKQAEEALRASEERLRVALRGDITHLRQVEDELREADQRKNEFLATLAHELRNPLAPMRNGLEILRRTGGSGDIAAQALVMMDRQMRQMVHLIDDLLDLSRISRGKIELRCERMELATAVDSALEVSRPLIEQAGHVLELDLPAEPLFVYADFTRLAQVFANLLNNAAKYTPRGGRIHLTVRRDDGHALLAVLDSGVGIPVPLLQRVFDMFTQVDPSLEKAQGGLGIGLSIAKQLVELHGGTISAHSQGPGTGSEFSVRLPLHV